MQPPPAILPVPRTRHAPQPVTSLRGEWDKPARPVCGPVEDGGQLPKRASPCCPHVSCRKNTSRAWQSRWRWHPDAGSAGPAVPLGSAECAVCVPSGSTEWHDISWQLRICRLPRHSVASSARCACHSMALSGTSVRQRSSGAIGEGAAPDGSTAAKGTWPTRARQRWRAALGDTMTLAHRGPRGAWYDGRQQPRDDGELSSGGSGSHYV